MEQLGQLETTLKDNLRWNKLQTELSFVQSTGISNVIKIFAGSSYQGGWSGAVDASGYVLLCW
jgi:hypothetical protein